MKENTETIQQMRMLLANNRLSDIIVKSLRECGLTHAPLVQQHSAMSGHKAGMTTIRKELRSLSLPHKGIPALLQEIPLRIEGKSGSATATYLCTEFGRQVLENMQVKVMHPHNQITRGHQFIQLELVTRARLAGWTPRVEHPLPYGKRAIRIDVLVERADASALYLEAEQELTANNACRADEKLDHWQRFGAEQEEMPQFWIVFNAPRKTLQQTIQTWRKALARVEEPNFHVWYCPLSDLADVPLEEALHSRFLPLEPLKEAEAVTASDPKHLSLLARQVRDYELDWNVWDEYDGLIFNLEQARTPAEKLPAFLALMRFIHAKADLQAGGYGYKYNAPPLMALSLLHKYLTLPDNQPMYEELGQAIRWAQGRGSMGVTMMKQVYTTILWDVFLAHHGFAREGQLKVDYKIADHLTPHQQSGVQVTCDEHARHEHKSKDEAALEWTLNALFLYAEPLGLGRLPWRK